MFGRQSLWSCIFPSLFLVSALPFEVSGRGQVADCFLLLNSFVQSSSILSSPRSSFLCRGVSFRVLPSRSWSFRGSASSSRSRGSPSRPRGKEGETFEWGGGCSSLVGGIASGFVKAGEEEEA